MRIGIKYELVIALLVSNSILAIIMFTITSWRFDQGFLTYVTNLEVERLQPLIDELGETYGEHQSWQALLDNPLIWNQLMFNRNQSRMPNPRFAPKQADMPQRGMPRRGPPPRLPPLEDFPQNIDPTVFASASNSLFDPRIILADKDKLQIIGPAEAEISETMWFDISWDNQVVGYIGLMRNRLNNDSFDNIFLEEQKSAYGWIAFGSLFIALCLGLFLAIMWLRPINRLQQAMVKLSFGDYKQRLEPKGNEEMADLAHRFNTLARTLEENKNIHSQWVADISHELRTPLSILKGEIEALVDGVRETNKEQLQSLHEEAMQLQALVNQLHELNMSDLGSLNYEKSKVDFSSYMTNLVRQFSPICEDGGIEFQYAPHSEPVMVEIDQQKFKQLFSNLFNNSLRYTDKPGVLKIEWRELQGEIILDWIDSSPSVGDEEKSKLFDRLYRGESSRNRLTGGSGLGLAIVRNIIEAHDGTIEVADSNIGGLKFTIRFPVS